MTFRDLVAAGASFGCALCVGQSPVLLKSGALTFTTTTEGFRYGFRLDGKTVIPFSMSAGLVLAGSPVNVRPDGECATARYVFSGTTATGGKVRVTVTLYDHHAELMAEPARMGDEVRFVTGGAMPAYGLADHAVEQKKFSTLSDKHFNTDVTGFADDAFLSGQGQTRLISNFVIYPKQKFAEVLIDPTAKIMRTSGAEIVQGVAHAQASVALHYFFGTPQEIYAEYQKARKAAGFPVMMPKYEAFGVGWEAFGALGWETNEMTDQESIDRYLAEGYPLRWILIGSGFWPAWPEVHETTSFGLWDHQKYPDPRELLAHFHDEKLKTMLELRITFITTGPYSEEGVLEGYFLTQNGRAEVFTGGWPKLP